MEKSVNANSTRDTLSMEKSRFTFIAFAGFVVMSGPRCTARTTATGDHALVVARKLCL